MGLQRDSFEVFLLLISVARFHFFLLNLTVSRAHCPIEILPTSETSMVLVGKGSNTLGARSELQVGGGAVLTSVFNGVIISGLLSYRTLKHWEEA